MRILISFLCGSTPPPAERHVRKSVLQFSNESEAERFARILAEMPPWDEYAKALIEGSSDWRLECYDDGSLTERAEALLQEAGLAALCISCEDIPDFDWVSETQKALPPVRAFNFIIHGSHDEITSIWGVEIDAGRAFGTAHHGTTKGCIEAIARLSHIARLKRVLDLGSGSGVLAIVAAKALRHKASITAVDIDPIAVAVARENCLKNGTAPRTRLWTGDGIRPAAAYAQGPYDLVVANILARPLIRLAGRLNGLVGRGGYAVLSGLLASQAREVSARYLSTGFALVKRHDIEGWTTLILRRV